MALTRTAKQQEELKTNLSNLTKIAVALIDSHISIRETQWKLRVNGKIQLPKKESTEEKKLNIFVDLYQRIMAASDKQGDEAVQEWINITYHLYQKQKEQESTHPTLRSFGSVLTSLVTFGAVEYEYELLMPLTAESIRNMIISTLNEDPLFKATVAELVTKKGTLATNEGITKNVAQLELEKANNNNKLIALTNNDKKQDDFFRDWVQKKDARTFNEKSFADFVANVLAVPSKRKNQLTLEVLKALGIEVTKEVEQPAPLPPMPALPPTPSASPRVESRAPTSVAPSAALYSPPPADEEEQPTPAEQRRRRQAKTPSRFDDYEPTTTRRPYARRGGNQ